MSPELARVFVAELDASYIHVADTGFRLVRSACVLAPECKEIIECALGSAWLANVVWPTMPDPCGAGRGDKTRAISPVVAFQKRTMARPSWSCPLRFGGTRRETRRAWSTIHPWPASRSRRRASSRRPLRGSSSLCLASAANSRRCCFATRTSRRGLQCEAHGDVEQQGVDVFRDRRECFDGSFGTPQPGSRLG